jgi:hypothetical protein
MSISLRLRVGRQHLRAMSEGCTYRAAIAGSIASAALATLVFCLVYRSVVSSSMCMRVTPMLHEALYDDQAAVPSAAPSFLTTHEPYTTVPPSFLSSPRYQGICNASAPQQRDCSVGPYNASSPGAAQPCTPDNLQRWDGTGSWSRDEDGHYRRGPAVLLHHMLRASWAVCVSVLTPCLPSQV